MGQLGGWARAIGFALVIAGVFTACGDQRAAPPAVRGVVDARDWDFEADGNLQVEGEWEAYWRQDLTPRQIAETSIEPEHLDPSRFPEDEGYGTFRLRVLLPPDTDVIGVLVGPVMTASIVYFDGKVVLRHGELAQDPSGGSPSFQAAMIAHAVRGHELEVVVRASNYDYLSGGLGAVFLGEADALERERELRRAAILISVGAMLVMAFYHLAMFWLRRQDRAPLYFALACFSFGGFALVSGDAFMRRVLEDIDGVSYWRMFMLAWFTTAPSLSYYLYAVFPQDYDGRWLKPFLAITAGLTVVVLAVRPRHFMWTIPLYQALSVGALVYAAVILTRAVRRRRQGAWLVASGMLIIGASFFNDVLVSEGVLRNWVMLSPVALFIFILLLSVVWGVRISGAFDVMETAERTRSAMFRNTSHELRTPLNGILGFAELLRRGHFGELPPAALKQVGKVHQLGQGLLDQVNTILDLARSRSEQLRFQTTAVDLGEAVSQIRNLADGLALREPDLHFKLETSWQRGSAPWVETDRDKLLTILRNLVGNAFKFREPGAPHTVSLRVRHDGKQLEVDVEDTGIGIPTQQKRRIFEEFVQLHDDDTRAYEGTGLGLSLVQRLVHGFGGDISVDSTVGKGSAFRVKLPAPTAKDVPKSAREELATSGSWAHEARTHEPSGEIPLPRAPSHDHILIVDDNATNLDLLREVLGGSGYAVRSASGGKMALEKLEKDRPDLVLLDLMMPDVSGEDVLKHMRESERLHDVPVILLTARASQDDRIVGLRAGADDYLPKPVDPTELVLRVHNTLQRAELARDKSAQDANMSAAQAVQQTLLPIVRAFPGVVLADHYQAAEQVGGDWFDYYFDEDRGWLFVAVGDVTGHGVSAALVTASAAGAFKATCWELSRTARDLSLGRALEGLAASLNHALLSTGTRASQRMTMALVCVDVGSGEAAYLNAGHNPVFVFGGERVKTLVRSSQPLGVDAGSEYVSQGFSLASGQGVFLYTDGLVENEGPDGRVISARRIRQVLEEHTDVEAIKSAILMLGASVWKHAAMEDDCSFVVLQRHD